MKKLTALEVRETVSKRLIQLMRRKEVTGKTVAEAVNMTEGTFSATLRGERDFKVYELYSLAVYFKCDITYFLPWDVVP